MTVDASRLNVSYPVHTPESAPEPAKAALRALHASVGIIPNLAATMAESPALLTGFLALRDLYGKTSFSPAEVQVLSLTAAYENDCAWCIAFHSAMALKEGVDNASMEALRRGTAPDNPRFAALSTFVRAMVRQRGAVDDKALQAFADAGFMKDQVLDVIMGIACSTMANYAGHVTRPPLDAFLQPLAWTR